MNFSWPQKVALWNETVFLRWLSSSSWLSSSTVTVPVNGQDRESSLSPFMGQENTETWLDKLA